MILKMQIAGFYILVFAFLIMITYALLFTDASGWRIFWAWVLGAMLLDGIEIAPQSESE